jgi:hypothetical protein
MSQSNFGSPSTKKEQKKKKKKEKRTIRRIHSQWRVTLHIKIG